MAATSIHIKPVKGGSEQHNRREKKLLYVKKELTPNNEYWESDSQANRLAENKALVKKLTGRKMQAKATPIREAVVVIDERTTMDDLKRLADRYQKEFGIDCFQIAIHRDEGHEVDGQWKPNLHAHMVFDWLNHKTGKSIKLIQGTKKNRKTGEVFQRDDMSRMQDIAAEVLHMDRGVSSNRQHLSSIQYKNKAAEEHLKAVEQEIGQRQAVVEKLKIQTELPQSPELTFGTWKGYDNSTRIFAQFRGHKIAERIITPRDDYDLAKTHKLTLKEAAIKYLNEDIRQRLGFSIDEQLSKHRGIKI